MKSVANNYMSFLICDHENVANLYINGNPIGSIIKGEFRVFEYVAADGSRRPVDTFKPPLPVNDTKALKERLKAFIDAIPDEMNQR